MPPASRFDAANGISLRREICFASMPQSTRKRTPDSIKKRLSAVEAEYASADPLKRLHLAQERLDLRAALAASESKVDLEKLEKEFVKSAAPYSERKGISYSAWRELGVPAPVLDKA